LLSSYISTIGLGSCASQPIRPQRYVHPTATQQTFMQDRFSCIKEAQQPEEGGYVGAYGGSHGSTVVVSRGIFIACMAAKDITRARAEPWVRNTGCDHDGALTSPTKTPHHLDGP
jgi:hypothetical protein